MCTCEPTQVRAPPHKHGLSLSLSKVICYNIANPSEPFGRVTPLQNISGTRALVVPFIEPSCTMFFMSWAKASLCQELFDNLLALPSDLPWCSHTAWGELRSPPRKANQPPVYNPLLKQPKSHYSLNVPTGLWRISDKKLKPWVQKPIFRSLKHTSVFKAFTYSPS